MTFVQFGFLNVVGNGGIDEACQRFAGGGGLANRGGGDGLIDLVEQVDGHAGQHKVSRGGLLLKWAGRLRARAQTFGQGVGDIGERVAWPARDDEFALAEQRLRLMPLGDVGEGVNSDQQEKAIRFLE